MPAFGTGSLQIVRNADAPTLPKLPRRNEAFFDNLLVSAYTMQHTQDLIRSNVSTARFNEILATVIDTRLLLRNPTLHLDTAMHLILSRTQKVSGAPGAALYIAERGMIEYVAGTGIGLGLIGTSFPESQCAFFTRAQTRAAVEWGEVEDPKVKQQIGVSFELRAPVCSGGKVVGCLELFSRIRQFHPEIAPVCELMTAFLGQIIVKQAPPNESHLSTNSAREPWMAYAAPRTTPLPVLRSEPQRNGIPNNNQLTLRTNAPASGQRSAGDSQSEEEQLPTLEELLGQLGVAMEEGALLENPQPRPDPPPESNPVQITANAPAELTVVPMETIKQASHVITTMAAVTPVPVATDPPGKTQQTTIRKMRGNVAFLIFPTSTLIFCVSLGLTQKSVSSLFQALTFFSIVFSLIELWRAGYRNR